MDLQTGLVYVGIVVISAAAIAFISMFGTREKSYEEAIAEQRKLPDDLLLNKKDKNKEKKHKKAGKKVKEKKEEKDDKDDKDERTEHVQFEEAPQMLPSEPPIQESNKSNKKKGKLEKIKPILVNKDEPLVIVTELGPSQLSLAEANHFDLIHPKDDLELVRSQSRENLQQIAQIEIVDKANKSPKDSPTKSKKNNKDAIKKKDENTKDEKDTNIHASSSSINKETVKEIKEQQKETPVKEVVVQLPTTSKEPKKTKKKTDILSQIDGDAVNVELLMLCIQKAELSRSEIQILTNQLLNKQQDNPLEHSEWTEGRADPVIKLKKQLAEKEKALADEHEASIAFQNKLKELRAEFTLERSRLLANIRQFEESFNVKVAETQTLQTRMQHILESHAAEKQGFGRQIEQLQSKVNEDSAIIHKLKEDQGQAQSHLQQELMAQRKQMEVQFAQMHENENALKVQLAQKHVEVQDLQNELSQVVCNETNTAEIESLHQQLGMMQGQLMHSEGQLQHFKETNDRLQDIARQLEESRRVQADLDHRLKSAHRHEQELQKQVNSLQAELNIAKSEANETTNLKIELGKTQTELIKLKSELSTVMNDAKSEAAQITVLKTTLSNKEDELKKSRDEFDAVQNDLLKSRAEIIRMQSMLNVTQEELNEVKTALEKTEHNLTDTSNEMNKYQNEAQKIQETLANTQAELTQAYDQIKAFNETTKEMQMLQTELDRLQSKNDRLRAELSNALEKQKKLEQQKEQQEKILTDTQTVSTNSPAAHDNLTKEEKALLETLRTELMNKQEELTKVNERIRQLESNAEASQNLIQHLQEVLESQKSKNNELRTKNWKAMEAVSNAESFVKTCNGKIEEAARKAKEEQEEITKALLQRIFPEIKVDKTTYEQWLQIFEDKVCVVLEKLKETNAELLNADLEKQNKNMQDMVTHYKKIIYDTENILNKLQKHIESEELKWQKQLQQKQSEVVKLKLDIKNMKHIQRINEQLMSKIELLEKPKPAYADYVIRHVKDRHNIQMLQQQNEQLTEQLDAENDKRATLNTEVKKLRSLIQTSEANLTHEKCLVLQLQQEVSQLKKKDGSCNSSEQSVQNGPPPTSDSLQSESPLASQALSAALENTLHKNTELANCSITKPVNLTSQSEQEIENSPLSTKYSSKSCHMTDHNTQASWNPLNGQQHKKHKKKRKGGSGKK